MNRGESAAQERRAVVDQEYAEANDGAEDAQDDEGIFQEDFENEGDDGTGEYGAGRFASLLPRLNYEGVFLEARQQDELDAAQSAGEGTHYGPWRLRDRCKTVNAALVLCLNVGVDPPDVVKIPPCAKLECWTDPFQVTTAKAVEVIGKNLQTQYERLQQKARFKQCLDPTIDDVKKLCLSLRKSAKDDRVLFHYNGHGVPKPTASGEVWVFNKEFTQYIPLSILDLQNWLTSPTIYVFDCSSSGLILQSYLQYNEQRERELELRSISTGSPSTEPLPTFLKDSIFITSCGGTESLPTSPSLPADFLTSCLTTPVKIALRCFAIQSHLFNITEEMVDQLPGRLSDRKTPIGELNWILTAITDTIAWNAFPKDIFQKLFRQDVLVASLMRNFLLAERLMRSYRCTPASYPALPSTYGHPAWNGWDMAVEHYLLQLPSYLSNPSRGFRPSRFFHEQLTAFQVWLDLPSESRKPPEQLPIVLQVLLSQSHRLRALRLISRFVNLGEWAVHTALSVGIFPYVLRLLQSTSPEVKESLINIWSRILLVDKSCQEELLKDNAFMYFFNAMAHPSTPVNLRVRCAVILCKIMTDYPMAQSHCLSVGLMNVCVNQTLDSNSLMRQWACLSLSLLWKNYEEAKRIALKENCQERLLVLMSDNVPEVRAAALCALGNLIGHSDYGNEHRINQDHSIGLGVTYAKSDVSSMVRSELIITLSKLVESYKQGFRDYAFSSFIHSIVHGKQEDREEMEFAPELLSIASQHSRQKGTTYAVIWEMIKQLSSDPMPSVSQAANTIISEVSKIFPVVKMPERAQTATPSQGKGGKQAPTSSQGGRTMSIGSEKPPAVRTKPEIGNLRKNFSNVSISPKEESSLMKKVSSSQLIQSHTHYIEQTEASQNLSDATFAFPQSLLYDQSCRIFSISNSISSQDTTSPNYMEKIWKKERHERLDKDVAIFEGRENLKFDKQTSILGNDSEAMYCMLFHPYEAQLAVADDKGEISVHDINTGHVLNKFKNGNPAAQNISSLRFYCNYETTLLSVASNDGAIRIWKKIEYDQQSRLVTGWYAYPDFIKKTMPGVVMDWKTDDGLIVTGCDQPLIKVWSMQKELCQQELPKETEASVTTLTAQGALLLSGFSDGTVKLYDTRIQSQYCIVNTFKEHKTWITNAYIQQNENRTMYSGSYDGEVKIWDIRSSSSVKSLTAINGAMLSFAVHPKLSAVACSSRDDYIRIMNSKCENVGIIHSNSGFLAQRPSSTAFVAFHPRRLLLAAGSSDGIISTYTCSNA